MGGTHVHSPVSGREHTRIQAFYFSRLAIAAGHPINWLNVRVPHLRQLRLAAVRGFPNLADYLYDRLLDAADLNPGYDEPIESDLFDCD